MNKEQFFTSIQGKTVTFCGIGRSHMPLIRLFQEKGALVSARDKRSLEELGDNGKALQERGVQLILGENYLGDLREDIIFRTPGMKYHLPQLEAARKRGAAVTSEMEVFFQLCPCKIYAVTGSDGKTTTTSIIAELLKAQGKTVHLGGNIGKPLLPEIESIQPEDCAVVELSSFQLISMRQSPEVAVVTNVTPNHLDHHKDMQEYIDAKRNILLYQAPGSRAVLGYANDITRAMAKDVKGSYLWFTRFSETDNGGFLRADGMLCVAKDGVVTPIVHKSEVALRGEHNLENLLAAFCAVWGMVDVAVMAQVARSFQGVEHRIEPVRTLNGVQWFNDSIASSPTRVIAGLRAFSQKLIILAGGSNKRVSFAPLAPELLAHVKTLVLISNPAEKAEAAARGESDYQTSAEQIEAAVRAEPGFAESGMNILHAESMQQAVRLAYEAARPGDIVSLSPACASFDFYPNFEVRGRHYKELVNAL